MNITVPKIDAPYLLLRPAQAAKALSISPNTLESWTKEYGIERLTIRGQHYFSVEALQRFIEAMRDAQDEKPRTASFETQEA